LCSGLSGCDLNVKNEDKPAFDLNKPFSVVKDEKISIPETIEAPLIVQGECIFIKQDHKPFVTKNGETIDTKDWTSLIIENGIRYEGKVCIAAKEFQGQSPYNIPFVATIFGEISELYIDNIKIKFNGEGEIFFRQKIPLEFGYNRIPVKVVGKSGRITESFIEQTIENIPDKIEIK
jgi:hypothetical protein